MTIRKGKSQEIQYNDEGEPYAMWGKTQVPIGAFYRETVRFVDPERKYWHGMDCTRDLVIHLSDDGDSCVLGKVS